MPRRAVFFLSDFSKNDFYMNWLNPFLISYFRSNSLPLICVYAGFRRVNEAEVRKTIEQLPNKKFPDDAFGLYVNWDNFDWCTQLGYQFGKSRHRPLGPFGQRVLRKLSIFLQEDFDELLYLDLDSVVLKNLEPLFDFLNQFDIGFGEETSKEWVYNESADLEAIFGRDAPYYSSGMMLFRKGLLTRQVLEETVTFGAEKNLFHSWKGNDQAIINLAVMRSGLSHTNMKSAIWGRSDFDVNDSQITSREASQPYIVHWAGSKRDPRWTPAQFPHMDLLRHYDPDFSLPRQSFWQRMLQRARYKLGQLTAMIHYFR